MSAPKARRRPKAATKDAAPSPAARLNSARLQVFKVMSIIASYRLACATLRTQGGRDPEAIVQALSAAFDILDDAAGDMEGIVAQLTRDKS